VSEPFVFRQVVYLVESARRRAASLDELLRGVNLVPSSSISYHMHREFLDHRFVRSEWPNDFAYWVARVIGDEVLAERLANLNVFSFKNLEGLRAELARLVADHLTLFPEKAVEHAPHGREFYFQANRALVMDTGARAADLSSFAAALRTVPSASIYYHLFETRFAESHRESDFAAWFERSLGMPELAARLQEVDPYMFSLEEARARLLRILGSSPSPIEAP
jgi:hypothetical protein